MTLLEFLSYVVTIVGILLCLFSMIFIFVGKRIPGDKGEPQIIKYKDLELRTSSIITILLVSVAVTALPLCLLFYLEYKRTIQPKPPTDYQLFLAGRIDDETGRPLEGATAEITEIYPNGKTGKSEKKNVDTDGTFEFAVSMEANNKLKLETHKEGYRKQKVILQLTGVNFPSVLIKKKDGE